jgi:hypothetical protein
MANTFVKIATVSLGSAAASIDFTSIPSTYTDLCLKISGRSDYSGTRAAVYITFNSNTGSNYSSRRLIGYDSNLTLSDSSSAGAPTANATLGAIVGSTATASTFSNNELYMPNYAGSTNKSFSHDFTVENNSSSAWQVGLSAALWDQTSAITSISLSLQAASNFVTNSTATLYGISNS